MSFKVLMTPPSRSKFFLWSDVLMEECSSDDGKATTDLPCQLVSGGSLSVDDKGKAHNFDLGKRVSQDWIATSSQPSQVSFSSFGVQHQRRSPNALIR